MDRPRHPISFGGCSAAEAGLAVQPKAMRLCRSCKRYGRDAAFRVVHPQVHALCGPCAARWMLARNPKATRAAMRRAWTRYTASARRRQVAWQLGKDDFVDLWAQPCWFCMARIPTIGLVRIDTAGPYSPGNVLPCCRTCIRRKGAGAAP